MRIRLASRADVDSVAPLLAQLGYPSTRGDLASRFERLEKSAFDPAWVAVDDREAAAEVVGFAAAHLFFSYELNAPLAELTSIVVDERSRGTGTGRALVAAFEEWAAMHGAARCSLATSQHRVEAHAFYERLGYQQLARKYEKNFPADRA